MSTSPETGAHRGAATAHNPTRTGPAVTPADLARPAHGRVGTDNSRSDRGHPDHGNPEHSASDHNGHADRHKPDRTDQKAALNRQKDAFGGIKWGSAFFGWLTAVGTAVLLSALAAAVGGAFGLAATGGAGASDQLGQAAQNPGAVSAVGIVATIVALVVLLIAYYCGGYVAGRMARFNGMKQGIAVWVWTIIITVLAAILVAVAGSQSNILGGLRLPLDPAALSVAGIITAVAALIVSLVGAILGGLAGMRFHRKVDRTDLGS